MARPSARLHLVVALDCEARPLIRRFALRRETGTVAARNPAVPVWRGDNILLTVSGVGATRSAAAVRFLRLYASVEDTVPRSGAPTQTAWLNLGVGGHRDRPVGAFLLAHRVEDETEPGSLRTRAWFPRFAFAPPCPTATVRTVANVERGYADDVVYEMEAAAFMEQAIRSTSAELVHVGKVISDGPASPVEKITGRYVEALIEARVGEIAGVAGTLLGLAADLAKATADPTGWDNLRARWRFTETQQYQLRRLLLRWETLLPDLPHDAAGLGAARNAREALARLAAVLGDAPPRLGEGSAGV